MSFQTGLLKDNALKGKVVLVTGGGTGLGKSMGHYFCHLGARLIISSRNESVLQETAREMQKQHGEEVLALPCDVRDYEAVAGMFKEAINQVGRVDAVVNNAAANFISPTERLSPNAFHTILDIVLKGTANMTLVAGKHWINSGQAGNFLNIVTTYAFTGSGYVVPSAAAKAGVLAMTRSLAVEWAKYNIRSNAIAPGPFPTEGAWSRLLPDEMAKQFDPAKRVPLARVGEHQELSNLAAFLLADQSGFINGEVVTIDGGEWLRGAGQFNDFDKVPKELWDQMEKKRKGK
ncbi:SDR family oxidoreductase [Pleomorphovibrio marinus]|uniref:SDR family oxidoreductase n=1 Tax=Pleomorphovibrio marinus TaxID=2164132 RepID=UPI000E0A6093|nr:SDR family oxidoreductase [Pleomorphovibrio marinus]